MYQPKILTKLTSKFLSDIIIMYVGVPPDTVFYNQTCTPFNKLWYAEPSLDQAELVRIYKWCQILLFTLKYSVLQSLGAHLHLQE